MKRVVLFLALLMIGNTYANCILQASAISYTSQEKSWMNLNRAERRLVDQLNTTHDAVKYRIVIQQDDGNREVLYPNCGILSYPHVPSLYFSFDRRRTIEVIEARQLHLPDLLQQCQQYADDLLVESACH